MAINWLDPSSCLFPPVDTALSDPNGLLALGGDLRAERLIAAYQHGIFPWYEAGQPILWWSPDPRMVLFTDELHISRSLAREQKRGSYRCSFDEDFEAVVRACAAPRHDAGGTWITSEMLRAYGQLHQLGVAHSVEVWRDGLLTGGLYGVALGQIFFGESMFSRQPNTSKLALAFLVERLRKWGYPLIDCQLSSRHLASLGAREIPRREFVRYLTDYVGQRRDCEGW